MIEGRRMGKRLGARLRELFSGRRVDESFFEDLEDTLIEADLGARVAMDAVDELRDRVRRSTVETREELQQELKQVLQPYVAAEAIMPDPSRLNVFLVLGVNGVGKTTTIAKLAEFYRRGGGIQEPVLAAGDTFRAAAIDQLKIHGDRLGLRVVSQSPGADPGAVIFDAIESAKSRNASLVLADTAGRMHTKANLVKEMQKIHRVVESRIGDGVYRTLLVIDATTGQNGLRQAEIFNEAIGVSSCILTKYDSTAKGGIALAISHQLGIPFSFLGTGEKYTDLEPFDADRYLDGLVGVE